MLTTLFTTLSLVPANNSGALLTVSGVFIAAAAVCAIVHLMNKAFPLAVSVLCLCVAGLVQVLPKD